jgi:geranylgeranyl diphosphate synthase, type I
LKKLQDRYGSVLEAALASRLAGDDSLAQFWDMMRYQLGYVDESLNPVAHVAGKRFRPFMCLLVNQSLGGRTEDALPTACAIELLHNFSLIHDDIEDHDPSRRHRPTLWKNWGEPHAINAGDGMFALASRTILDTPCEPKVVLPVVQAFQEMALALTKGQFLDMSFEQRQDVSRSEYLNMIGLKSGAIIEFSAWAGAVLSGGSPEACKALRTFGRELGKAFQIRDDVQGIWAEQKSTGKLAGKDLLNRKKTLPVVLAWERGKPDQIEALNVFFGREHDDVKVVLAVLAETKVKESCEQEVSGHLERAVAALEPLQIDAARCQELISLGIEVTGQLE